MRARYFTRLVLGALTLSLVAGATSGAQAQTTVAKRRAARVQVAGGATTAQVQQHRTAREARLQAMTPEQRKMAMAKAKHRARAHARHMTPAQRVWAKSARTQARTLHSAVKAGSMTREVAAAQRKAWRSANPRPVRKPGR